MRIRHSRIFWLVVIALIILTLSARAWLPVIGWWLSRPATPVLQTADVIVVHGGNPDRRTYGIALYEHNLASKIWLTGYSRMEPHIYYMVVNASGVPQQAYRYLDTTSTWSDGHEIAAAIRAQNVKQVIIVTDWWHSRRALCATEQQLGGYNVAIEFAPSPAPASPDNWWEDPATRQEVLSELVKIVYYAFRYRMNPWGC